MAVMPLATLAPGHAVTFFLSLKEDRGSADKYGRENSKIWCCTLAYRKFWYPGWYCDAYAVRVHVLLCTSTSVIQSNAHSK
ncbi:hypothetical protein L873DRAFT_1805901 [Choiromyces venosus 120613-1]|uniref:Uncharacterized protein n=1 Tax=Choiromyces venosus 120613-1 TaxID=1336337 RepID=A0A3N4JUH3_9PEZI|nr:hypothetical protein L873DRAFT_1805901 [Choiromyces venosus 120613-1]